MMENPLEQLPDFFQSYSRALSKNILVAVLGRSRDYIPINTGALRRNTVLEEDATGPFLISKTFYAEGQYYENLYHLVMNKRYQSISKSNLVVLDSGDIASIRTKKGSEKFKEGYWTKLRKLREAGMLTRTQPRWFEQAFEDIAKTGLKGQSDQALDIARKAIREGQTYTVDI